MPYKLRKVPKKDLYWVVGEDGTKHSKEGLPKEKAEAQMRAMYASKNEGKGACSSKPAKVAPAPPPRPTPRPRSRNNQPKMGLGRSKGGLRQVDKFKMLDAPDEEEVKRKEMENANKQISDIKAQKSVKGVAMTKEQWDKQRAKMVKNRERRKQMGSPAGDAPMTIAETETYGEYLKRFNKTDTSRLKQNTETWKGMIKRIKDEFPARLANAIKESKDPMVKTAFNRDGTLRTKKPWNDMRVSEVIALANAYARTHRGFWDKVMDGVITLSDLLVKGAEAVDGMLPPQARVVSEILTFGLKESLKRIPESDFYDEDASLTDTAMDAYKKGKNIHERESARYEKEQKEAQSNQLEEEPEQKRSELNETIEDYDATPSRPQTQRVKDTPYQTEDDDDVMIDLGEGSGRVGSGKGYHLSEPSRFNRTLDKALAKESESAMRRVLVSDLTKTDRKLIASIIDMFEMPFREFLTGLRDNTILYPKKIYFESIHDVAPSEGRMTYYFSDNTQKSFMVNIKEELSEGQIELADKVILAGSDGVEGSGKKKSLRGGINLAGHIENHWWDIIGSKLRMPPDTIKEDTEYNNRIASLLSNYTKVFGNWIEKNSDEIDVDKLMGNEIDKAYATRLLEHFDKTFSGGKKKSLDGLGRLTEANRTKIKSLVETKQDSQQDPSISSVNGMTREAINYAINTYNRFGKDEENEGLFKMPDGTYVELIDPLGWYEDVIIMDSERGSSRNTIEKYYYPTPDKIVGFVLPPPRDIPPPPIPPRRPPPGEEEEAPRGDVWHALGRAPKGGLTIRNDYSPSAKKMLNQIGNLPVVKMTLRRDPIGKWINRAFNLITLGKWEEAKNKMDIDKLFHTSLEFTVKKGNSTHDYIVEKNEVIQISKPRPKSKDTETLHINTTGLSLAHMLNGAKRILGNNFFTYDPFRNNCQDFISAILKSNGLATKERMDWLKQPVLSILEQMPSYTHTVARFITDLGAKANVSTEGAGQKKKTSRPNLKISELLRTSI